jgi:hypothetical protein
VQSAAHGRLAPARLHGRRLLFRRRAWRSSKPSGQKLQAEVRRPADAEAYKTRTMQRRRVTRESRRPRGKPARRSSPPPPRLFHGSGLTPAVKLDSASRTCSSSVWLRRNAVLGSASASGVTEPGKRHMSPSAGTATGRTFVCAGGETRENGILTDCSHRSPVSAGRGAVGGTPGPSSAHEHLSRASGSVKCSTVGRRLERLGLRRVPILYHCTARARPRRPEMPAREWLNGAGLPG